MDILSLLVVLILFLITYWAVHKLAGVFGSPPQLLVVVDVLLVILFVLYVLRSLGLLTRVTT